MKLSEDQIQEKVLDRIREPRESPKRFAEITDGFEGLLKYFNPQKRYVSVEEYFGKNKGFANARALLLKDGVIEQSWLRKYQSKKGNVMEDFKGVYVFLHGGQPFYVGISKGVIKRIIQHVKGTSHNTSTLAHKIGTLRYEIVNGKKYIGARKELDRKSYVKPVKDFLMHQQVAFLSLPNDDELALFEIYCSMRLGTMLNSFETH